MLEFHRTRLWPAVFDDTLDAFFLLAGNPFVAVFNYLACAAVLFKGQRLANVGQFVAEQRQPLAGMHIETAGCKYDVSSAGESFSPQSLYQR